MSDLDLSVVVPVHNNATTLDALLDRLVRVLEVLGVGFELILVDDGSTDDSWAILRRRAAADQRIRGAALTRNFGGQSAICAGFDLVRGKRTVCLDADLENYPEDIPALLAELERGADLACGVREVRRGSRLRRFASTLMNAYVRRVHGRSVRDIGCGMRAMDSTLVHNLAAEGERRRLVTPLLLSRARAVVEVPIRHQPTTNRGGHSLLTLLAIALDFYLLTARRPFLVWALVSLAEVMLGLGALAWALVAGSVVFLLVGVVLVATGLLGCVVALVGEYTQRLYILGQGVPFYDIRELIGDPLSQPDRTPGGDHGA